MVSCAGMAGGGPGTGRGAWSRRSIASSPRASSTAELAHPAWQLNSARPSRSVTDSDALLSGCAGHVQLFPSDVMDPAAVRAAVRRYIPVAGSGVVNMPCLSYSVTQGSSVLVGVGQRGQVRDPGP